MSSKKTKNIFIEGAISPSFIAESIEKHQHKTGIGAHQIFMGQVRADEKDGERVTSIEFTAHEEMALAEAHKIREEIFDQFDLQCMHIHHSLGSVRTGEICFFVFVSSAHRNAANEACKSLVENLKSRLPIFGKEVFDKGSFRWKQNTPDHD